MKMLYMFAAATLFLGLNELRGQSEFDTSQDISGTYIRYQVLDQVSSTCTHDHGMATTPVQVTLTRISDTEYEIEEASNDLPASPDQEGMNVWTLIGNRVAAAYATQFPGEGFTLDVSGSLDGVVGPNNYIYSRLSINLDSDAPDLAVASYPFFGAIPCHTIIHQMFIPQ